MNYLSDLICKQIFGDIKGDVEGGVTWGNNDRYEAVRDQLIEDNLLISEEGKLDKFNYGDDVREFQKDIISSMEKVVKKLPELSDDFPGFFFDRVLYRRNYQPMTLVESLIDGAILSYLDSKKEESIEEESTEEYPIGTTDREILSELYKDNDDSGIELLNDPKTALYSELYKDSGFSDVLLDGIRERTGNLTLYDGDDDTSEIELLVDRRRNPTSESEDGEEDEGDVENDDEKELFDELYQSLVLDGIKDRTVFSSSYDDDDDEKAEVEDVSEYSVETSGDDDTDYASLLGDLDMKLLDELYTDEADKDEVLHDIVLDDIKERTGFSTSDKKSTDIPTSDKKSTDIPTSDKKSTEIPTSASKSVNIPSTDKYSVRRGTTYQTDKKGKKDKSIGDLVEDPTEELSELSVELSEELDEAELLADSIDKAVIDYPYEKYNKNIVKNYIETALTSRNPKHLPDNLKDEIKVLAFQKTNNDIMLYGSANYRVQKWFGDFDLIERFSGKGGPKKVVSSFVRSLKKMVETINKSKLQYFSDFKAGLDDRYSKLYLEVVKLLNGDRKGLAKKLDKIKDAGLLDESECTLIKTLSKKSVITKVHLDVIKSLFRDRSVLRWTAAEIKEGKKTLPGGKKMKLSEAVSMNSPVKIDEIIIYNNTFIEITNYVLLSVNQTKNKIKHINIEEATPDMIKEDLKKEIEKYFYNSVCYNPFKGVKRLFALCRLFYLDDENKTVAEDMLQKIIPIVTGDVSMLYQIKSELSSLIRVLELGYNPKKAVENQLNIFKLHLPNILFIEEKSLEKIQETIDSILKEKNKDNKIEMMTNLMYEFEYIINQATILELNNIDENPIPRIFFPTHMTYSHKKMTPSNTDHVVAFELLKLK